jgi:hypothetical protein
MCDLQLLESVKGLEAQQPHTDYAATAAVEETAICSRCHLKQQCGIDLLKDYTRINTSYSFIIALYDNTPIDFLYENPFNKNEYIRKDRVILNKYEGVLWEAATIHRGGEYDSYNARLFGKYEGNINKFVVDEFEWRNYC